MPMHRGIKLRHLRIFAAVVEAGSISGAARALGLAQPSLSTALADLEAMVGVGLLHRAGRGVTPTPEGETFLRHVRRALGALDAGAETVQTGTGPVKIGLLPTVAGGVFPDAALALRTRRPGLRVGVISGPHSHLLGLLRRGRIDLMVGRMPDPAEMPGLRFDWLYDEPIVLVARAGHPMAGRPAAEALARAPLILPNPGAIIRRPVEDYLAAALAEPPEIAFEMVALAPALRLLERSDLLWFISRGVVERELASGALHGLPLDVPYLSGAVGITARSDDAPRDEVEAVQEALREAVADRAAP